jgi:hypothetical protein
MDSRGYTSREGNAGQKFTPQSRQWETTDLQRRQSTLTVGMSRQWPYFADLVNLIWRKAVTREEVLGLTENIKPLVIDAFA